MSMSGAANGWFWLPRLVGLVIFLSKIEKRNLGHTVQLIADIFIYEV